MVSILFWYELTLAQTGTALFPGLKFRGLRAEDSDDSRTENVYGCGVSMFLAADCNVSCKIYQGRYKTLWYTCGDPGMFRADVSYLRFAGDRGIVRIRVACLLRFSGGEIGCVSLLR